MMDGSSTPTRLTNREKRTFRGSVYTMPKCAGKHLDGIIDETGNLICPRCKAVLHDPHWFYSERW